MSATAGPRATTTTRPPGEGPWRLDNSHFDRPFTTAFQKTLCPAWDVGQTATLARYGILVDEIAWSLVEDFFYIQIRPVGMPKNGRVRPLPPKLVFQALCALHPALRARIRTAREAWSSKLWRRDLESWQDDVKPALLARLSRLQRVPVRTLDPHALAAHVDEAARLARDTMTAHFSATCTTMVPVGAFLAEASRATGAPALKLLALLAGAGGHTQRRALVAAREALAAVAGVAALEDDDPRRALARLRALDDESARPLQAWLESTCGRQVVTGDLDNPTGEEMPHLIVDELRAPVPNDAPAQNDEHAFLSSVPIGKRADLKALLDDARACYVIRDERCALIDAWSLGLLRRALLAAGAELVDGAALLRPEHAFECAPDDVARTLRGDSTVSATEAARRAEKRAAANIDEMPLTFGPPEGAPPPTSWLPKGAREINEAMLTYVDLMDRDDDRKSDGVRVRGFGASPGRHVGIARHVLSPDEMGKMKRGDVLIARCTMPSYNALFSLAGGVATDRGGILSHAAIVSREFGIPSVVGCRDVTKRVPDGAKVILDGDAGTVEVVR